MNKRSAMKSLIDRFVIFLVPRTDDYKYLRKLERRIHNQRVALREHYKFEDMRNRTKSYQTSNLLKYEIRQNKRIMELHKNLQVHVAIDIKRKEVEKAELLEAINKIAPWLSASITYGDPCREYVAACNKIFELDRK